MGTNGDKQGSPWRYGWPEPPPLAPCPWKGVVRGPGGSHGFGGKCAKRMAVGTSRQGPGGEGGFSLGKNNKSLYIF